MQINITITDVIAIIGAMAWLPPVISAVRNYFRKPELRIIVHAERRISYGSTGPSMILDIAILTKNKDVLIDRAELLLTHEDKDEHLMHWIYQEEHQGAIDIPLYGSMLLRKTRKAVAIYLQESDLAERTLQFHDSKFISEYETLRQSFLIRRSNLTTDAATLQNLPEYAALRNLYKRSFLWKEGTYSFVLKLYSVDKEYISSTYSFRLSQSDLNDLNTANPHLENWLKEMFIEQNLTHEFTWPVISINEPA